MRGVKQDAFEKLLTWRDYALKEENGVLVASDEHQEWLLSWWWENYSAYNDLPVTFVDLGLSSQGKQWCEARGERIDLPRFSIPQVNHKQWEKSYGKTYEKARQSWFKKPLALLQSPYKKTLWCDLDCEVLGSLNDAFSYCTTSHPIALVKELGYAHLQEGEDEIIYNGGVVVYERGSSLIPTWARKSLYQSEKFWGDDRILSRIIFEEKQMVNSLPSLYNWRIVQGVVFDVKIVHWAGEWGKNYIRQYGGLLPLLRTHPLWPSKKK